MKKFILKGLLTILSLGIIVILIYLVDPYYLFTNPSNFDKKKYDIGYSLDQGRRYKIFTFWNNPKDKIILGASEINVISERNIPEKGWNSLSYGGAPLQESLRMYWETNSYHKLKEVIIAPEFIKYYIAISSGNGDPFYANYNWATSQSKKALDIYKNKPDYFIDRYTIKSTYNYILSNICTKGLQGVPDYSKEEFWKVQLDYAHSVYEGNTIFQHKIDEVIGLFRDIKQNATKNGIKIKIVIPIQHVDLLKVEFQNKVYDIYIDYIKKLVDIFGEIYYLAYIPNISDNNDSFSDPFHYLYADVYLNNIFTQNSRYILTKKNIDIELEKIHKILLYNE